MPFVQTLKLQDFRCYEGAQLGNLAESAMVVLYGPNGAGKTNILEALSLLSPGRGLRGASAVEMQRVGAPHVWGVFSELFDRHGPVTIGTGLDPKTEKRNVKINGAPVRGQNALAEYLSCIWLTPQMDRLFIDSSRERRKFLDRLVFTFDPGHAGRLTRYETALRERSKVLQGEARKNAAWLDGLEAQIAETGVAIAAARLDFAVKLQKACLQSHTEHFPLAGLAVTGTIEELVSKTPALEVEQMFTYQLKQSRARDAQTGGAATGPHKSDLKVRYAAKQMPAEQCSTGEQKALLIGLILAHARLITAERGSPPLILLDEVAAHLDEGRRAALYGLLQALGAQVWLTGTDRNLFSAIEGQARFVEVRNGALREDGGVFYAPREEESVSA
ncbi:MAG: DNA replication/repair protein RecF [Alphaproteobacteria bacterium]|nr:DNA replication/repair protein RecF [Alphaproteobacteria bacterium]MCD8525822.1 DNA replication/repair protein RecF [Alphaproteobacteria bacterium]MCD8571442.1 DNA replication/repair protein RecF [Alphaproteobacteria bacterium]